MLPASSIHPHRHTTKTYVNDQSNDPSPIRRATPGILSRLSANWRRRSQSSSRSRQLIKKDRLAEAAISPPAQRPHTSRRRRLPVHRRRPGPVVADTYHHLQAAKRSFVRRRPPPASPRPPLAVAAQHHRVSPRRLLAADLRIGPVAPTPLVPSASPRPPRHLVAAAAAASPPPGCRTFPTPSCLDTSLAVASSKPPPTSGTTWTTAKDGVCQRRQARSATWFR